ncbi:hypothetical protein PG996_014027 [Apiospora saccharicola]|uniref:MARVEL domain-containing protein n=1 Tax=Apiospora saccharicola TaxID=335842 RepID=A0ABR1TJX0_9PEZI
MNQSNDLQTRRAKLRETLLKEAICISILILLITIIGIDALAGPSVSLGLDLLAVFAVIGLVCWSGLAVAALSTKIPDRHLYCIISGSITFIAEVIVFLIVPVPAWAIEPLVMFFSFWAAFAAEYFLGIIYRPVDWYVKRAVPETTDRQGVLGDEESRTGSPSSEDVPLTSVVWEGRGRRTSEQSDLPPDYEYGFSSTRKPLDLS